MPHRMLRTDLVDEIEDTSALRRLVPTARRTHRAFTLRPQQAIIDATWETALRPAWFLARRSEGPQIRLGLLLLSERASCGIPGNTPRRDASCGQSGT